MTNKRLSPDGRKMRFCSLHEVLLLLVSLAVFFAMLAACYRYTARNDARAQCAYFGGAWVESAGECLK